MCTFFWSLTCALKEDPCICLSSKGAVWSYKSNMRAWRACEKWQSTQELSCPHWSVAHVWWCFCSKKIIKHGSLSFSLDFLQIIQPLQCCTSFTLYQGTNCFIYGSNENPCSLSVNEIIVISTCRNMMIFFLCPLSVHTYQFEALTFEYFWRGWDWIWHVLLIEHKNWVGSYH